MDNQTNVPPASQTVEIPPEIRNFLEGLLTDANMAMLDDEMKEEMVNKLYARLNTYLTSEIVENLPSDKMEEFIRMNEEGKSKEEMEQFFAANIPNAQEVFSQAFIKFRDLYLGSVTVSRNGPPDIGNEQQVVSQPVEASPAPQPATSQQTVYQPVAQPVTASQPQYQPAVQPMAPQAPVPNGAATPAPIVMPDKLPN